MNTLYISDLDGTLLQGDAALSGQAVSLLQRLLQAGAAFTCATARSVVSAAPILAALPMRLPIVLMNGACLYDLQAGRYVHCVTIPEAAAVQVAVLLQARQLPAFLYRYGDNTLHCYHQALTTPEMRAFAQARAERYSRPFTQVPDLTQTAAAGAMYFTLVGSQALLQPVADAVADMDGVRCAFYADVYEPGAWYLEIFGAEASKYHAVQFLRRYGGFDRVIGFGDNRNDLPMFAACDAAYAVGNACPEVQARATAVIGTNREDAVPRWITNQYFNSIQEGAGLQ